MNFLIFLDYSSKEKPKKYKILITQRTFLNKRLKNYNIKELKAKKINTLIDHNIDLVMRTYIFGLRAVAVWQDIYELKLSWLT